MSRTCFAVGSFIEWCLGVVSLAKGIIQKRPQHTIKHTSYLYSIRILVVSKRVSNLRIGGLNLVNHIFLIWSTNGNAVSFSDYLQLVDLS